MFGNNYTNPYFNSMPTATQPYGYTSPYMNQPNSQMASPNTYTNKVYVSNADAVRNKELPANSDYIFLDNDKPILYQKIVDGKGQFEVKMFKITPYEEPERVETDYAKASALTALEDKIKALEAKISYLTEVKYGTVEDNRNHIQTQETN